jgi:O-antigen/teichoic acid export membrane protein
LVFFKHAIGHFRSFFKVGSYSIVATIFKIALALCINKLAAELLSIEKFTFLYQFINFFTIVTVCTTGAIDMGIVKLIAKESDEKQLDILKKVSFKIILLFFVCTFIVLLIFASNISNSIFHSLAHANYIRYVAFSAFFIAMYKYYTSVLNGYRKYKAFYAIDIVQNLILLILFISLIFSFAYEGAILAYVLSPIVSACILIGIFRKNRFFEYLGTAKTWVSELNISKIFIKERDFKSALALLSFSVYALFSAVLGPLIEIKIRNGLIFNHSVSFASIWDAQNRINGLFMVFVSSLVNTYFLPHFASITQVDHIKKELSKAISLIIIPVFSACIFLYFLRNVVINVMFSTKFEIIAHIIGIQLSGCVVSAINLILTAAIIARIKNPLFMIPYNLMLSISYYFIIGFTVSLYSYEGLSIAYLANNLFSVIILIGIFLLINKKVSRETIVEGGVGI